jgi:antitoxin component of RelBE/YafQ-DinJ toxin-antitoxin module
MTRKLSTLIALASTAYAARPASRPPSPKPPPVKPGRVSLSDGAADLLRDLVADRSTWGGTSDERLELTRAGLVASTIQRRGKDRVVKLVPTQLGLDIADALRLLNAKVEDEAAIFAESEAEIVPSADAMKMLRELCRLRQGSQMLGDLLEAAGLPFKEFSEEDNSTDVLDELEALGLVVWSFPDFSEYDELVDFRVTDAGLALGAAK